jgi:hypothetical protein
VVGAFAVAALFVALFVAAERRVRSPLLRLDLFANRSFAISSVVAVVGMFSFLGSAYTTSIRLGPIQHQSPLRTAVAFLLLNGPDGFPDTGHLQADGRARPEIAADPRIRLAGMASATTSLLGDFGFTLGPAVIGALGHGYAIGYVVCGGAALACCLLALIALRGGTSDEALGASGEPAAVSASAQGGFLAS